MIPPVNGFEPFVDAQGRLTLAGQRLLQAITEVKRGWTAPTGTALRTTFDTSTVTTEQLAQRVKALIDDLTNKDVIGP
jgi:hypothetical protein